MAVCWIFAAAHAAAQEQVTVQAEVLRYHQGTVQAQGDAQATIGGLSVCAKELEYDRAQNHLRARGEVMLKGLTEYTIAGAEAAYSPAQKSGEVHDFSLQLEETALRAAGPRLRFSGETIEVEKLYLSSCPKQNQDWRLVVEEAVIDDDANSVSGKNLRFEIGGIPIAYAPFATLPYGREKRGGFLRPKVQYRSNEGLNIGAPYYLFLADNYDATITPHWYGEHGWLLENEFRYLTPRANGEANFSWTPFLDDSRGWVSARHSFAAESADIRLRLDKISDDEYFRDFSSDREKTAVRHLPTAGEATYRGEKMFAQLVLEKFQTIDDKSISPPHNVLPKLRLGYADGDEQHDWRARAEFSRFDAVTPGQAEGERVWWRSSFARRFDFERWTFAPEGGFHAAGYRLRHSGDPKVFVPYARLDARSRQEQVAGLGESARAQFRLLYAFAPARRQNRVPVFDTELRQLTGDGIFHHNRFVGGDRAADANFLAYGWRLRWWDKAYRREQVYLSFAQRFYFRAPQVRLPEERNPPKKGFANLLADMRAQITDIWRLESVWEWNPDSKRSERFYFDARADFSGGRLLRAGVLLEDDENIVFGASSPLGKRFEAAVFVRHLLNKHRLSEATASLLVNDDCDCWRLYLLVSDKISTADKHAFNFSLGVEFVGLGGIGGNKHESVLSNLRN